MRLNKDDAVKAAIEQQVFRRLGDCRKMVMQFAFDDYMDRDGNLDEDELAQAVADGFSGPVMEEAKAELQAEKHNPLTRGAGQLWIVHETIPALDTNGKGKADFEEKDQVGILGQTWYDMDALKNALPRELHGRSCGPAKSKRKH